MSSPKTGNENRFYAAGITLRENLQQGAHKTSSSADVQAAVEISGVPAAEVRSKKKSDIRILLNNIYAVNEDDVSKVIDENGEPLVVYRSTGDEINTLLQETQRVPGREYSHKLCFISNPEKATRHGEAVFLRSAYGFDKNQRTKESGKAQKEIDYIHSSGTNIYVVRD